MRKQEEDQIFHFILTLVSVKMKVKFPCKMAIEQSSHPLTNEVPPNEDGKFLFNQELRLRQQSDKLFSELSICLVTEKGARYISGIVKLYHNELIRSQGDRLVVSLSKCLDTQSFCELRVDKIIREGAGRKRTLTTIPERNQKPCSPRHPEELNLITNDLRSPKKHEPVQVGFETRSESHFPVTANIRLGRGEDELRGRDYAGMTGQGTFRKGNLSPKARSRQFNSKNKYQPAEFNNDYERQKIMQAEVYKDNYQKLKQKYLKEVDISKSQLNRRIMLENNENNYKLEIVRLKIRNQQLQKTIVQKNGRLKELSVALSTLQSREADINLMREDVANKEHTIHIMDDTIISLSKENDQLRTTNKEGTYRLQQKILILQNQLEMITSKATSRQEELQRQVKNLTQNLQHKQNELARKTDMLQKQKRSVYQLQRNLQNKLFQFDSQLQNQRSACKSKIDESKSKIDQAHQLVLKTNLQKNELSNQIDKLKGLLLKSEYQFKLFQQEIHSLKAENEQIRPIRDKYNEIMRELRSISEQKIILQKNHQKIVISKQNTLEQLTSQYKKQIEFHKKNSKQIEQKSKIFSSRLIQSQAQLQLARGSLQKHKKNNEHLTKELAQLKQKQKQLRKSLKGKEEQCEDSRKQISRIKQKNQSLLQSTKGQFGKNRQELARIKIQLESQLVKNQQLVQTNSQINMELARMKMSQQYSQQKYQKLMLSAQQKYSQFQKIIKQHESVIQLLQQKIRSQKSNEKDYLNKLHKCDYEINMVFEKNDKIIKEIKSLQQRNRQFQAALKGKHVELIEALKKISEIQAKLYATQENNSQLKDQLQFSHNQLQKLKKIAQIIQKDYEKAKLDIMTYCQKLNERQKQIDQKTAESRKDKDSISSLQTKCNNIKKEYEKFKDSVSQALQSSFTQVIQSFAMDKFQNVKNSNYGSADIQSMMLKRGITDMSNDLVSAINSAGKQNKNQITKLNERIKSLQRDLQMLKSQLDRSQQSNRRQITQKSNQILQLEEQLTSIKSQKGQVQIQNTMTIQQLQDQLRHYQQECQSLVTVKNELQFSITSLRMEVERVGEQYQRKYYQLRNQKGQLQQKLQYQCRNTQNAQKRVHELQIELMNINSVVILQKEQNYKKQLKISEFVDQRQKIVKQLQVTKKSLKQAEERYTQLDIQFITIKQIKQKYESMLTEQQGKLKQVRVFNNSILKQKEQIIKKQLQKNLQITQLQNSIADLRHSLQQQQELKAKFKSQLEQLRQSLKRYQIQFKDIQNVLAQQKVKYNQIRDKLRQKEQQFCQLKEQHSSLKKKWEQGQVKNKSLNEQFRQQNDMLVKQLQAINSQSSQKIRALESQLAKAGLQLQSGKEEAAELEEALFVEKENNSSMQESINKLKFEIEDFRKKLEQMEKVYEQLAEENREKDEHMFEMGGKLYEYENRMREMEEQKQREIEQLNNNLSVKYDEDYQQINQKIQFIEKEKQYFKDKYNQKEQEISKKNEELKHRQIEEIQFKKMYEQKIKKLQQQKLSIFTDKNKQTAKILQDNKSQFQNIRLKQTQLRKITHQLQISRSSIQKLQSKVKQMQTDRNTQIKAYQTEIQNLRKKQLIFKSFKDTVKSNQWSCEREVRKLIQSFIKKVLEGGDKQVRNETLIGSIKTMEQGLLAAISMVGKDAQ